MVEISTRSSSQWVLDYFLNKIWSYLLQTHFVLLNSKNSSISVNFCIFAQNHENQALSLVARSSSGWVLMTLKVLPSKSSWSQDYFTYLSCCHTSHRSQVTTLFMTKFNSLLSYIHIFHIFLLALLEVCCNFIVPKLCCPKLEKLQEHYWKTFQPLPKTGKNI